MMGRVHNYQPSVVLLSQDQSDAYTVNVRASLSSIKAPGGPREGRLISQLTGLSRAGRVFDPRRQN